MRHLISEQLAPTCWFAWLRTEPSIEVQISCTTSDNPGGFLRRGVVIDSLLLRASRRRIPRHHYYVVDDVGNAQNSEVSLLCVSVARLWILSKPHSPPSRPSQSYASFRERTHAWLRGLRPHRHVLTKTLTRSTLL